MCVCVSFLCESGPLCPCLGSLLSERKQDQEGNKGKDKRRWNEREETEMLGEEERSLQADRADQ